MPPEPGRRGLGARIEGFLWDPSRQGRVVRAARVLAGSLWKFNDDRGFLRASALTYSSLLSIVPLLALMFSVLKGLGVQRHLEPLLLEHLAVGNKEVISRIVEYVDRTRVGSLGAVGLVTLVLTAVAVIGNVERSLNDIWRVGRGRSLVRKVSDYLSLLIVGPILLFASISLTTTLQSPAVLERVRLVGAVLPVLLRFAPFVAVWVAFTALYVILPNRRVPLLSALLGGVTAGTVWQVAEWAYIRFQFGVTRYNAIYGALAQLPILLVWMYLSWCIVLWGAELAFVHHLPGRGLLLRARRTLWVPRLDTAWELLGEVVRRFARGEPGPTETDLVGLAGAEPSETSEVLARLSEEGLLVETQDDPPRLVPARCPDRTTAAEVVVAVARLDTGERGSVSARVRDAVERDLAGVSWAALVEGQRR